MNSIRLFLAIACAAVCLAPADAERRTIPAGSKVFVEQMDQGLDDMIRAEVFEKNVDIKIVTSLDEATYVLTGYASDQRDRKWHEGWLTARKESASGSVSLVTKDGEMVWAMEASDKNRWWGVAASEGHRKVAKKIAEGLKDLAK